MIRMLDSGKKRAVSYFSIPMKRWIGCAVGDRLAIDMRLKRTLGVSGVKAA